VPEIGDVKEGDLLPKKSNWTEINAEAQAVFIQDLWKFGKLRDSTGIDNEAVKAVRKEWF
jgi:hypothetical protein